MHSYSSGLFSIFYSKTVKWQEWICKHEAPQIDNCFKNTALMVRFFFPPQNMSLCCFRPLPWKRAVIPGWKTRKICCLKGSSNLWAACLRENRQTVKIPVLVSAQKSAATAGHWCLAYTWLRPELLPATPLKRNENKLVSSCLQWCLWVCFVLQARIVRPDCRCFQGQCKYYSS